MHRRPFRNPKPDALNRRVSGSRVGDVLILPLGGRFPTTRVIYSITQGQWTGPRRLNRLWIRTGGATVRLVSVARCFSLTRGVSKVRTRERRKRGLPTRGVPLPPVLDLENFKLVTRTRTSPKTSEHSRSSDPRTLLPKRMLHPLSTGGTPNRDPEPLPSPLPYPRRV